MKGVEKTRFKPKKLTASIFDEIWIKQSGAMIYIFNLD